MSPCSLRRRLAALALAGCLALLPVAARALPVGSGPEGPAAAREQVRGWLDWLGQTFLSLRAADSGDNGQLIDPDGQPAPASGGDEDNGKLVRTCFCKLPTAATFRLTPHEDLHREHVAIATEDTSR